MHGTAPLYNDVMMRSQPVYETGQRGDCTVDAKSLMRTDTAIQRRRSIRQ